MNQSEKKEMCIWKNTLKLRVSKSYTSKDKAFTLFRPVGK